MTTLGKIITGLFIFMVAVAVIGKIFPPDGSGSSDIDCETEWDGRANPTVCD